MEIDGSISSCASRAPFALQVLGDSMAPEFQDGTVIIVDPGLPYTHGAYVVADYADDVYFRKWILRGSKAYLVALNKEYADIELNGEYRIRGVITQQARSRKLGLKSARHYG